MFKSVKHDVWAFDAEWVPDPDAGRLLYDLPADMPDFEVVQEMWRQNGATEEKPRPFLKYAMSRLVSIAMVTRKPGSPGQCYDRPARTTPGPRQPRRLRRSHDPVPVPRKRGPPPAPARGL